MRFLILPLHDGEGVHDVLDRVSWRRELFAEGGRRVTGPFFVGAEGETEEGGVEFAAELEAAFLAPPVWGPSISAVPGERLKIPEGYGSPGIRGGNHSAAVRPGEPGAWHPVPRIGSTPALPP